MAYDPDVVFLMLGGNDSKVQNWNETRYEADYIDFVGQLRTRMTNPEIHIMIPSPLYVDGAYNTQ